MTQKTTKIVTRIFMLSALAIATVLIVNACADDKTPSPTVNIDVVDMIDDLEDGDDIIIQKNGRSGDWYTFDDETSSGVQVPGKNDPCNPSKGGAEGSKFAMHTAGNGWAEWGAGVAFDLNPTDSIDGDGGVDDGGVDDGGVDDGGAGNYDAGVVANSAGSGGGETGLKGIYDASLYKGIVFRAKGNCKIRASILIRSLIDKENGGTCIPGDKEEEGCSNGHGAEIYLEKDWHQYALDFATITQDEGWGQQKNFDPSQLVSVLFEAGKNTDFDFWIDDVGFY